MAAATDAVKFYELRDMGLRRWVEANPGRVNDRDHSRCTPLHRAATLDEDDGRFFSRLQMVEWLVDEKGAHVDVKGANGETPLHVAPSLDVLAALLDRGADPTSRKDNGWTPLMSHTIFERGDLVERLLEDPGVLASVNVQNIDGDTALHFACYRGNATVHTLLAAGASSSTTNKYGNSPLTWLRKYRLPRPATYAVLEHALIDANPSSVVFKAYHLLGVDASNATPMPSCLQSRVERGEPLPCVVLQPVAEENDEEGRKLRNMMGFMFGMEGGPLNIGMPRAILEEVLGLL